MKKQDKKEIQQKVDIIKEAVFVISYIDSKYEEQCFNYTVKESFETVEKARIEYENVMNELDYYYNAYTRDFKEEFGRDFEEVNLSLRGEIYNKYRKIKQVRRRANQYKYRNCPKLKLTLKNK